MPAFFLDRHIMINTFFLPAAAGRGVGRAPLSPLPPLRQPSNQRFKTKKFQRFTNRDGSFPGADLLRLRYKGSIACLDKILSVMEKWKQSIPGAGGSDG